MPTTYVADVIAWSTEQAALLSSGKLSAINIEHVAEEIEDVGKSEQRELANRMTILLAHVITLGGNRPCTTRQYRAENPKDAKPEGVSC